MGERSGNPTSSALVRVPSRPVQPSWGWVLATTVRLSAVRRWRPAAAVLAAALTVAAALWLSGVLTGSAAPAARSALAGRTGTGDASGPGPAAASRSRAAAWIAAQVSTGVVIACYPAMCTALQVQGVAPGQLMPVRAASASPVGAEVLVTSSVGQALVRVVQASLKEHQVTVSYGPEVLGRQLTFGVATSYMAVAPGARTVRFAASGGHASTSVAMAADTVHTIVVLDDSSGLRVDALLDAAGSQIMPKGGAEAGFGGTAARAAGNPAPWLLAIAVGALLAAAGLAGLTRPRRLGVVRAS